MEPETLYSAINFSYFDYDTVMTSESLGFEYLIFVMVTVLFGMAAMYRVNPKILLSDSWSISKSIWTGIGILFVFRIIEGIYLQIGVRKFDISTDKPGSIPNILLTSRQEIEAIISTFGKGTSLLLVGLLVPIYEEIIFRGVILDSCQRYMNFKAALFAAIHMSWFLWPVFFLFGLLAGWMRKKSGGLLPVMVFHALNNTTVLIVLFVK